MLSASWIDQGRLDAAFAGQRAHWSHLLQWRIQVALACLMCALVPGPISAMEIAAIPVTVGFFVRLPHVWRLVGWACAQPVVIAALAYTAWMFASLSWSGDRRLGFEEAGNCRWLAAGIVLFAVMDRRSWLIAALCAGFVAAQGAQVAHAVGTWADVSWLRFDRAPDRNSGWWQPVVGGSMLVGALGLHLPAALMGTGRVRIVAAVLAAATLVGILATGSRGAWLAAAGLIGLMSVVAVVRVRPVGRMVRVVAVAGVIGAAGAGAAWVAVGESMQRRAQLGYTEVKRAIDEKQFLTDTGARLLMNWWAIEAVMAHPVRGVGAGGYPSWVKDHLRAQNIEPSTRLVYGHAHSAVLHLAATTGLVGVGLGALVIGCGVYGGLRGVELGSYAAGPACAIVGLMGVSVFDSVQVNTQTGAFLGVLLALCVVKRPRERGEVRG